MNNSSLIVFDNAASKTKGRASEGIKPYYL